MPRHHEELPTGADAGSRVIPPRVSMVNTEIIP